VVKEAAQQCKQIRGKRRTFRGTGRPGGRSVFVVVGIYNLNRRHILLRGLKLLMENINFQTRLGLDRSDPPPSRRVSNPVLLISPIFLRPRMFPWSFWISDFHFFTKLPPVDPWFLFTSGRPRRSALPILRAPTPLGNQGKLDPLFTLIRSLGLDLLFGFETNRFLGNR
jgi:hypothetical protein